MTMIIILNCLYLLRLGIVLLQLYKVINDLICGIYEIHPGKLQGGLCHCFHLTFNRILNYGNASVVVHFFESGSAVLIGPRQDDPDKFFTVGIGGCNK